MFVENNDFAGSGNVDSDSEIEGVDAHDSAVAELRKSVMRQSMLDARRPPAAASRSTVPPDSPKVRRCS